MLPSTERRLFGPGPSPVAPRIMRAMIAPPLSHLDPDMVKILDDVRARLARTFLAGDQALTLAVSGTGTAGSEAAVANVTAAGARVLVVVTGYFGERLVEIFTRYGARVERVDVEWGRACDPARVEEALGRHGADIVAMVHAETSTGVANPVRDICAIAVRHGALTVVDAVTSLGAQPLRVEDWHVDVCFSCTQKGLGAPSGLAPMAVSPRARERRVPCRSFYLDLALLESFWVHRKYHHTISAPLVYALREALQMVDEEGLEARWARHQANHEMLVAGLEAIGVTLLPPPAERLWSLSTVVVPDGIDEAAVRRQLLERFDIEIGAGLGPLAGRIWRVGFMGSGSTRASVLLFVHALDDVLRSCGYRAGARASASAAGRSL
ncbi:MAG TPA: alanine--glyoxylate aminotransferase family protein [Vicinamibacterales bacterium]|nr:alanine--glyoxylate aminotransferase family protein [Vicinamibacterales bacterium]